MTSGSARAKRTGSAIDDIHQIAREDKRRIASRTTDRRQRALPAALRSVAASLGAVAVLGAGLALVAPPPAAAGVLTGNCRVANQPAATLLIPYFQVDVDTDGVTTLVSINNASGRSELARVTLWTDWGVPTLAFDIYLTGYDVQTLNLRDLFRGVLPATGFNSPLGSFSSTPELFPGCAANGATTGQPPLSDANRAYLRAAHTGKPLPGVGAGAAVCAGSGGAGPSIATGYVTVDSVNRCTLPSVGALANTPADGAYFSHGGAGLASDDNVLWGDYMLVDPAHGLSEGQAAVSVVADADFFGPGDYTFYGRYVGFDARDDRMPLASLYYARYLNGGAFAGGTDLVVWRDNRKLEVGPSACASGPSWAPLGEYQLVVFDEEENGQQLKNTHAFPLATQRVHLGGAALPAVPNYGWLMLDLWHSDGDHAQGYVSVLLTAGGKFQVGHPALQADDLCIFGP